MSFKLFLVLLLSISHQAFASELSIDKIKAVADASLKQYVISESDSLTSISLYGHTGDSETYIITAVDQDGKCYQQSANVFVTQTQKIVVTISKSPRASCQ